MKKSSKKSSNMFDPQNSLAKLIFYPFTDGGQVLTRHSKIKFDKKGIEAAVNDLNNVRKLPAYANNFKVVLMYSRNPNMQIAKWEFDNNLKRMELRACHSTFISTINEPITPK